MKPSPFKYVRPESLDEAIGLLADHGDDARILAGGQSLLAVLNMRLAEPEVLVDIGRLDALSGISLDGKTLSVGALTRHADVMNSTLIAEHLPLIAGAMPHVAHAAVRSQGTFGGSLCHADPAAELPACALALGATFEAQGPAGSREIAADDFFLGLFETALAADEILTGARFRPAGDGDWSAFDEIARRSGDYAMAGLAAHGRRDRGGRFENLRLVFFGIADRPTLATSAAEALIGKNLTKDTVAAASQALANDLEPDADLYASAEMKMHLSQVLLGRAFEELIE